MIGASYEDERVGLIRECTEAQIRANAAEFNILRVAAFLDGLRRGYTETNLPKNKFNEGAIAVTSQVIEFLKESFGVVHTTDTRSRSVPNNSIGPLDEGRAEDHGPRPLDGSG